MTGHLNTWKARVLDDCFCPTYQWCFWFLMVFHSMSTSLFFMSVETPILWPPHAKSWLIGEDPDAGRDWGQEEKGTTEDEMAGWHHRLDGHEFEWTPGVGDGQGGLACCDSMGSQRVRHDWTTELGWTELNSIRTQIGLMLWKDFGICYVWKGVGMGPFVPFNFQATLFKCFGMNPIHLATHLAYFVWKHLHSERLLMASW